MLSAVTAMCLLRVVGLMGGETAAPAAASTGVLVAMMICVGASSTVAPAAVVMEPSG